MKLALAAYALWVAATYLLEGLPGTLLRPEAVALRLAYSVVANLAIGILLPLWLLRGWPRASVFGFSGARRTAASIAAAAVAGYALLHFSVTLRLHPLALVNVFAQTWVVSLAELLVCWGLVGGAVLAALRGRGSIVAHGSAAAAASIAFGIYHFAHSPPFNQPGMVAFLAGIGLATSAWWFVSRDVYGSAIFHNFFAVTGVVTALKASGVAPPPAPAIPVLATAALATLAVVAAGAAWFRFNDTRASPFRSGRPSR